MSLFRWLWESPQAESEWGRFVANLFNKILLLFMFFILILIVSLYLSEGSNLGRIPLLICLLLINFFAFALLKKGHLRYALHLFIWPTALTISIGSFIGIGVYTPAYLVSSLLILIGAMGLSHRSTILLTSTIVALGLPMLYGHYQGWINTPTNHNLSPLAMWITTSSIFLSLAFALITLRRTSFAIAERLQKEQALYRAVVEDQTELIVRWRRDGVRSFANEAYMRYFGLKPEEAIGTSFFPQISEKDHEHIRDLIASINQESPLATVVHRVVRADGTEGWQEWSDRAIFDDNGNLIEFQSVGRDITAAKELEERQRELELAKERESFLRDFLSTMSHDLQTPLSSMRANLYMLQHSPEKSEERIAKIDRQIDRLSGMIDDILTVARLEHLPELERRPLDLESLLESSLSPLREEARAKNIEIISSNPTTNTFIKADAKELQRALSNLISNAIKYTPKAGTVSIEIRQNSENLFLDIVDTGIGIDSQDLPFIFERFFRAKNAKEFEKGTGLGLPIVKRIIELHDGSIQVTSNLGQGSRFSIQLPLFKERVLV